MRATSLPLAAHLLAPALALALAACSGGTGETAASATESSGSSTTTTSTETSTATGTTASTTTTTTGTGNTGTHAPTIDDQGCLERCGELDLCIEGACTPHCYDGPLFGEGEAFALNCPDVGGCYTYEPCAGGCELVDGAATCTANACEPVGLDACPVTTCTQRWAYECTGCGIEFDAAACFEVDQGCTYPWLTCDLPEPCERVWAYPQQSPGTLEVFEDEKQAVCVLEALRAGTLARHELRWGEMGDVGDTVMEVLVDGQGGATFQWTVDCAGCPESGVVGRSGRLELQPAAYFDACLLAPTTASLLECIYGFTTYQEGEGPADGYTPPWTTGMCSALEFACPP